MNSGSVDLIATDPPFNKGKDFHATPDSLAGEGSEVPGPLVVGRRRRAGQWVDQITDDWPAVMQVITSARASYGRRTWARSSVLHGGAPD